MKKKKYCWQVLEEFSNFSIERGRKMLFITFEGPEGAGKTTVLKMIKEQLKQDGFDVIITREPGGNEISEQIRQVILNKENTLMDP